MSPEYHICTHCIMDSSDPKITFDESGVCNHCHKAEQLLHSGPYSVPLEEKDLWRDRLVAKIKHQGRRCKYDCIIGVSGGVDSSYVAYQTVRHGLRPLAIHLDNGWNSELSVKNIESLCNKLNIDLFTCVLDWEEFKDLQLSFLKSSTPDLEIPTDHAIISLLYRMAAKEGVSFILAGTNLSTESIMPRAWSQGHQDWKYIRSIQARFGTKRLKSFPHRTMLQDLWIRHVRRIQWVSFLDYFDYVKLQAMETLKNELGWRDYGGKHHESFYTKFYQSYILPTKFGFDKRRAHLSSLICAGQLTRDQALQEMSTEQSTSDQLKEDIAYFRSKLELDERQFRTLMETPPRKFDDYPSYVNSRYYHWLVQWYRTLRGL